MTKFNKEAYEALNEMLPYELDAYRKGLLGGLSSNLAWARALGICDNWVMKHSRRILSKEDILFRNAVVEKSRRERCGRVIRKHNEDPMVKAAHKKMLERINADPEFKKAQRERGREMLKRLNENPEFRRAGGERGKEALKALRASAGYKERFRIMMGRLHADPAYRERHNKAMERFYASPAYPAYLGRLGEAMKTIYTRQEFRKAKSEQATELMKRINADPEFKKAQRERSREIMKRLNENPEFRKAASERMRKRHADPKYQKLFREMRMRNLESFRKKAYHVEKRFFAFSQQEGAIALLLERYLPEKYGKTEDGRNFQVNDKGIGNGGIDFLVDGEFLEWHPVILYPDSRMRGDIPFEEYASYKTILRSLEGEDKVEFKNLYERVLAANYRASRQNSVDNSGYAGTNVALAKNERELYDFIARHGGNLPPFGEFRSEFNHNVREVKKYRVDKTKKVA